MAETTKPTSTKLPKDIFAVEVTNHELLKVAYDAYLANARSAQAKTKNAVKSVVAVRNRSKKVPGVLVSVARATQSGAAAVSPSVQPATRTIRSD